MISAHGQMPRDDACNHRRCTDDRPLRTGLSVCVIPPAVRSGVVNTVFDGLAEADGSTRRIPQSTVPHYCNPAFSRRLAAQGERRSPLSTRTTHHLAGQGTTVPTTSVGIDDRAEAGDGDRFRPIRCCSIADLPGHIAAPTSHREVIENGATVFETCAHKHRIFDAKHGGSSIARVSILG